VRIACISNRAGAIAIKKPCLEPALHFLGTWPWEQVSGMQINHIFMNGVSRFV
jgi:hypothetical protein